jgi:ribosomal protein S18 acetylase RimI-like enzyme
MDIELIRRGAEAPERATIADADAVASDLAAAFATDPLFDWFSRPDAGRDAAREGFFKHLLTELILETGEVLRPTGGGAAAVWMSSNTMSPNPLIKEIMALPMLLRLTGWRRFGRMLALREVMDRHHPMDRPHAYLWFMGVTPQAQGLGVGTRLLKSKTDQLDAEGRGAFLETATERNLILYRRHGFQVVAEYRPSPAGPPSWAMWRDPQARAAS